MIDFIQACQGLILGIGCAVLISLSIAMQVEENKEER